ncbi:MAG: SusC/RagA family TonB-linked outer membrane protein [Bacteroidales bacterium]|jgi:TonB-linked SusC/RagA family outer membrane protein|nr:SusC/RagA family TonB-linked outer membrane protein [Bacteroidales bacterium]
MRKFRIFVFFLMACSVTLTAQNINVTGTLTDAATGDPLPFATVQIKGTTFGTSTDAVGKYSLSAPANGVLIFSFMGYKSVEVAINGRATVNAQLTPEVTFLDDIIVVAYGQAKKESVTGSVSAFTSADIEKRSLPSVAGILDGAATGVMVVNTGGPSSTPSVRIRGFTSITGSNSPLYVVDGVPFSGNISDINPNDVENISVLKDAASAALYGNLAANGVILITTKRGRSSKVGVRATVRAGAYSWAQTEFEKLGADEWMETMWLGYRNNLMSNPDLNYSLEAANSYATKHLVENYLGYNVYDRPKDQLFDANGKIVAGMRPGFAEDMDWWDAVTRVGLYQDYTVSADHATDKTNFFISLGHHNNESNVIGSGYMRFTSNVNVTVRPTKWFSAGVKMNASYQETDNISDGSSAYVNPIYYGRFMSPIYPIHLHDMNTGEYILDENGNKIYDRGNNFPEFTRTQNLDRHVIWELDLNQDRTYRTTTTGNVWFNINFLKDFDFKVLFDYSLRNTENRTYNNAIIGDGAGNNGRASRTIYRYNTFTAQQILSWNKTLADKHNLYAMAAHENYSYNYVYTYLYKTSEVFANKYELINFTELVNINGYDNNLRRESYLGTFKYNFDSKYYLDLMVRGDGSSKFHPNNKWGVFWSVGASWSIHREPFMASVTFVDALKLRASYGQVGNDNGVGTYAWYGLYSNAKNGGLGASYKSQNEAADIRWESTNSVSVGLEGNLFNRLGFELDYYEKVSQDLLFSVNKPMSVGATSNGSMSPTQTVNFGSMHNRGVELSLNFDIIKTKDLVWNVNLITAWQQTKVGELPEALLDENGGYLSGNKRYEEGMPYLAYWTYEFAGIDQMTGLSLYNIDDKRFYVGSAAEEGKTEVPAEYVVQIGDKYYTAHYTYANRGWLNGGATSLPTVFGGFGTSLRWKNIDFSISFAYGIGGYATSSPWNSLMSVTSSPSAIAKEVKNAWNGVPAGMTANSPDRLDPNGLPKIDYYTNAWKSTTAINHMHSKTYLNVKNIYLAYNLSQNAAQKIGLSGLSINVNVDNAWLFTSLPGLNVYSTGGSDDNVYGTNRIVTVGLNLRF